jgi:chromosome segregation ATPase
MERAMSVEIHDKLIKLLADVDELKAKEAQLQIEKQSHIDQISKSEEALRQCEAAIRECQEHGKLYKSQMDTYRDELFGITEEAAPRNAEANDDEQGKESTAKKLWNQEARRHKLTVA